MSQIEEEGEKEIWTIGLRQIAYHANWRIAYEPRTNPRPIWHPNLGTFAVVSLCAILSFSPFSVMALVLHAEWPLDSILHRSDTSWLSCNIRSCWYCPVIDRAVARSRAQLKLITHAWAGARSSLVKPAALQLNGI